MKAIIFQPAQKVWTPRTPDSNYDSLGPGPLKPVVFVPLIQEGIGTGLALKSGTYYPGRITAGGAEGAGYGIKLLSATYTAKT